jgi:cell surface protein SprA
MSRLGINIDHVATLRNARGEDHPNILEIAKIELVGNAWQELGTSLVSQDTYTAQDSTFIVSVINDEDNPEYVPPKGVFGEYDQINQIRSKEQSLVLKFDNLSPQHKGLEMEMSIIN